MSKLTLEEAISHCLETAERLEERANIPYKVEDSELQDNACRECAADHRRLAEWLTELKDLREENKVLTSECDRLITEKAELLKQHEQIAEYKRLLKATVEDIHKKCSCECSHYKDRDCDICVNEITCDYDSRFQWVHEAEALKLIGDESSGV